MNTFPTVVSLSTVEISLNLFKRKSVTAHFKRREKIIGPHSRLRKKEDLTLWGAPVSRRKPPCFKCALPIMICWRGLIKREVMRNVIPRNNLKSRLSFFRHVTVNVDRGIGWDSAVKQLQDNGKNKFDGFYCSKREQKGRRLYLLAIQKESSTHLFNITR